MGGHDEARKAWPAPIATANVEHVPAGDVVDNARADALGLVFDSDPRRVNRTGATQGNVEPQPADQESDAA